MAFLSVRRGMRWACALLLVGWTGWLAGCASSRDDGGGAGAAGTGSKTVRAADTLSKGDAVTIVFSGNPTPPAEQEERIREDGTINLQFIGTVHAEGKTPGELQKEIQGLYVPKFFQRLTVTVKTEARVFFVDGEVRQGGRLVYTGQITVLRAIAAAGGFTDFAARTRIELIRSTGEKLIINERKAQDDAKLDLPVVPGDRIMVRRRKPFGR